MASKSWQSGGVSQTQGPAADKALLNPQASSPLLQKAPEDQGGKIAGQQIDPRGHFSWLQTSMCMWEGSAQGNNPKHGRQ